METSQIQSNCCAQRTREPPNRCSEFDQQKACGERAGKKSRLWTSSSRSFDASNKLVSIGRWRESFGAIRAGRHIPRNLDLLEFPTILFYETGYSTYVLRQASRRSWRIGQKRPVRVGFLTYAGTAQESCLRLMGKKLLVSLAMEGKLQAEGLQAIDEDDDVLTAMARELVTRQGVGEEAAEIWRSLQQQSVQEQPAKPATVELDAEMPMPAPAMGPPVQLSLF